MKKLYLALALTLVGSAPQQGKEIRGVWVYGSQFANDSQKLKTTLDQYASIGLTDLFCFYASGDLLKTLVKEARARNMRFHPIFSPGYRVPLEGKVKEHPEWLIRDQEGKIWQFLNVGHPEARKYIVEQIKELLTYDVDGIHLDYCRYQCDLGFSYDPATCEAFKKEYGESPLEIKHRNCGSVIWCEWLRWNARQVTQLVKEIREAIVQSGKKVVLTAAVFPDHETSKLLIGQDWEEWVKLGLVDEIYPMLYTPNTEVLKKYTRRAVEIGRGKCRVAPGIALVTTHGTAPTTHEHIVEQIRAARELGADGTALFAGVYLPPELQSRLAAEVFGK